MRTTIGLVVGMTLAGAFALIVWPTRYMFDRASWSDGVNVPVRVDRWSGDAEYLTSEGWQRATDESPFDEIERELRSEAVARVTGRGAISGAGIFDGTIYNGTGLALQSVDVLVDGTTADGEKIAGRRLRLLCGGGLLLPYAAATCTANAGFVPVLGTYRWSVAGARFAPAR